MRKKSMSNERMKNERVIRIEFNCEATGVLLLIAVYNSLEEK